MLNKRIRIAKRAEEQDKQQDKSSNFGKSGQPQYTWLGWFWANETFSKGVKALHEGALDAYDTVMFRLRFHACIDRWCLIRYNGTWYQIMSFNPDEHENTIQITAQEMPNQNVTIVEPESDGAIIGGGSRSPQIIGV